MLKKISQIDSYLSSYPHIQERTELNNAYSDFQLAYHYAIVYGYVLSDLVANSNVIAHADFDAKNNTRIALFVYDDVLTCDVKSIYKTQVYRNIIEILNVLRK